MGEFKERQPLKRAKELHYLSHDHHHGLLLSWKIRTGFKKEVSIERMKTYTQWFYENYLDEHFKIEEETVFPILGEDHELVQRALNEHAKLRALFLDEVVSKENLLEIETLLNDHIRFEERTLFQVVQEHVTEEQLARIEEAETGQKFVENTADEFWL